MTTIVKNQTNLQKRGGRYYFRTRIPKDLLHHFKSKREARVSLKTHDPKEAKERVQELTVEYTRKFAEMRAGKNLNSKQIHSLAQAWIAKRLLAPTDCPIHGSTA